MNKINLLKKYWLYILLLFIAIIFLIKPTILTIENHQLAKSGLRSPAIILDRKWESSSYRNEDGFYYSFFVNGISYSGHTFDTDKMPNDTISIIYLFDRPNVNRPYDFIKRNYLK